MQIAAKKVSHTIFSQFSQQLVGISNPNFTYTHVVIPFAHRRNSLVRVYTVLFELQHLKFVSIAAKAT